MRWLITGGSGSFGSAFIQKLLSTLNPEDQVVCYSRDPERQADLARLVDFDPRLVLIPGDVRDLERLLQTTRGVDLLVHAAALKNVLAGEFHPSEYIQTNLLGTWNVLRAIQANQVPRALLLSTDKAVEPQNLYGCTKAIAERLWLGSHRSRPGLSVLRYGNILDSRGSVLDIWRKSVDRPWILRDPEPTRFALLKVQGVALALAALEVMQGGELFVPAGLKALSIWDLAQALDPGHETRHEPLRPGEKQHERLLTDRERSQASVEGFFWVLPAHKVQARSEGIPTSYTSDRVPRLRVDQIRQLLAPSEDLESTTER